MSRRLKETLPAKPPRSTLVSTKGAVSGAFFLGPELAKLRTGPAATRNCSNSGIKRQPSKSCRLYFRRGSSRPRRSDTDPNHRNGESHEAALPQKLREFGNKTVAAQVLQIVVGVEPASYFLYRRPKCGNPLIAGNF